MALSAVPDDTHITYQQQFRKCSKKCVTCRLRGGHGPYWYAYWREGTRVRSTYIGKSLPASITARLKQQQEASAPSESTPIEQQGEMAAPC